GSRCAPALAATIRTRARKTCVSAESTVAVTGRGALRRAGPVERGRSRGVRSIRPAVLTSALPGRLGHHAEALDAGAADQVHGLDHRPVREPRVGLEVQ